jgi:hypothetical protein
LKDKQNVVHSQPYDCMTEKRKKAEVLDFILFSL